MALEFGIISDVDHTRGLVRVTFPADDIVSAWIPVSMPKTLEDEYFIMPDLNDHVWAIMDEHSENGVVGGAIYSKDKKPSQGAPDQTYIKFKDGSTIVYDRSTHEYTVTMQTTVYKISRAGFAVKRGTETLKKIISDTLDQIVALTVTCAAPGSPSTVPVNLPAFNAIKARLLNLFTE
jgi:phage baseplate assembly protein V